MSTPGALALWLSLSSPHAAFAQSQNPATVADSGLPVEMLKQWKREVKEATPEIGVIEGEDVTGLPEKRAFSIVHGEEEYVHPGTPPLTHSWSGANGELFSLRMYASDAAAPEFPLDDPDREWETVYSFRWRLVERATQLLSATTTQTMGWGLERLDGVLDPAPFWAEPHPSAAFLTGFNNGITSFHWLRIDDQNFLSGSAAHLWSFKGMPLIADAAPGVIAHIDINGRMPKTMRSPEERLHHWEKLEHRIRRELQRKGLTNGYDQLLSKSNLPNEVQLYLQKERNAEDTRKLNAMQLETRRVIEDAIEDYVDNANSELDKQEARALALPRSLGRLYLQSMVNTIAEGGTPFPAWLSQGLENRCSLRFATTIRSRGVYPAMPPPFQPEKNRPPKWRNCFGWNAVVSEIVERRGVAPTIIKLHPGIYEHIIKGQAILGRHLHLEESTRAVDYLYTRFGAGRVVEMLQRMGSGYSADAAFKETIGMTPDQFIAVFRAQDLRRAPTAKAGEQWEEAADEEVEAAVPDAETPQAETPQVQEKE